jgi:hypothetical protein
MSLRFPRPFAILFVAAFVALAPHPLPAAAVCEWNGIERIVADLAAAEFIPPNRGSRGPTFDGAPHSVVFVRILAGPQTGAGLEIVRIAEAGTAREPVVIRTHTRFVPRVAAQHDPIDYRDPVVLLRAPYRLSFSYAGRDRVWRDRWQELELPSAISRTTTQAVAVRSDATGTKKAFRNGIRHAARKHVRGIVTADVKTKRKRANNIAKGRKLVGYAKAILEAQGCLVDVATNALRWQFVPETGTRIPRSVRHDFFGVWDIIAVSRYGSERSFYQVTTRENLSHRRDKILAAAEDANRQWSSGDAILCYRKGRGRHFEVFYGPDFSERRTRWELVPVVKKETVTA